MMNVEVTVRIECDANCANEYIYEHGDAITDETELYALATVEAQIYGWICSDDPIVDYCPRHREDPDADHTAGH